MYHRGLLLYPINFICCLFVCLCVCVYDICIYVHMSWLCMCIYDMCICLCVYVYMYLVVNVKRALIYPYGNRRINHIRCLQSLHSSAGCPCLSLCGALLWQTDSCSWPQKPAAYNKVKSRPALPCKSQEKARTCLSFSEPLKQQTQGRVRNPLVLREDWLIFH